MTPANPSSKCSDFLGIYREIALPASARSGIGPADGPPLHRRRGAHRGRKVQPDGAARGAVQRPPRDGGGRGEPVSLQLLLGPNEVCVPDSDVLPAVPL